MRALRYFILALGASFFIVPVTILPLAAQPSVLTQKMNIYIGCINRLSQRSYDSRDRYFSWVGKNGPTGKERIIYGTYTIYDTSDCKRDVEKIAGLEPHEAQLEASASTYVQAVVALAPLLKEADDYYEQQDYKDDKMAKGKSLHPRLVAAWDAFETADKNLRSQIEEIQDKKAAENLAEIEKVEGRKAHYYVEALMMAAKRLVRAETASAPDTAKISETAAEYETLIKASEQYTGSSFNSAAKAYLVTAKLLMRRIRDKVPYTSGQKMILASSGAAWMVEGSPSRLTRDYNELIESYNRGANF